MSLPISSQLHKLGSSKNSLGIHSSRTMMLAELRLLMSSCPDGALLEEYQAAIIDENVLLKRTVATRKVSFLRLKELYLLDKSNLFFRSLLDLWDADISAQPLIALLLAVVRDPVLESTVSTILSVPIESIVTPIMIADAVAIHFPNNYNATTIASISRNIVSTWQQAGLLQGKLHKVRSLAQSHPASLAYALFLGYLAGCRGEALFQTEWCRLLDTPINLLYEQARIASQLGWLEYRHMGNVVDIGFHHLLRK